MSDVQEWFTCEYFDNDAAKNAPFEYPDEGGWVTANPSDGTLKHAQAAAEIYRENFKQVRIVRNVREIVSLSPSPDATPQAAEQGEVPGEPGVWQRTIPSSMLVE